MDRHNKTLRVDNDLARAIEASFASQRQEAAIQSDVQFAAKLQQMEADQELAMALTESGQDHMERQVNIQVEEWKVLISQDRCQGSWDCRNCTLINRPYEPQCSACHAKPPLHVLTYTEMPSIRFGLEIEIIIPNGRQDGFTLQSIAENLSRLMDAPVRFEGYTHKTTNYWKIVTDASVNSGDDKDLCFELVSPVLQGEQGLSSLRGIMDSVRRLGISTNASCGFHVHVDAEEDRSPVGSLTSLKRISQCFVSLENAFDVLVALSWDKETTNGGRRANKNRYCQSNRLVFGEKSNRQRWKQISSVGNKNELVALINPSGDRYRKLNLTNITKPDRPSTCEFRQHGGVEDLQEAEAWVRLLLCFCDNVARGGFKKEACLMPEGSSPKDELLALFHMVGCDGLEQFFAVERRLFLEGRVASSEWECSKCWRKFASSRSLAQHKEARGH